MTFLEFLGNWLAVGVGIIVCIMLAPLLQNKIIILVMAICSAACVVIGIILGIVGAFMP